MLGSVEDAEDLVQETMLRSAARGHPTDGAAHPDQVSRGSLAVVDRRTVERVLERVRCLSFGGDILRWTARHPERIIGRCRFSSPPTHEQTRVGPAPWKIESNRSLFPGATV